MLLPELKFKYVNYRGEVSWRTVLNPEIYWGNSEYHKKFQWMLSAWDTEKDAVRHFAVKDILEFGQN